MTVSAFRSHSAAFLAEDRDLRRKPRLPARARPEQFYDNYDQHALYYDCFRYGGDVLLVGPPPHGFERAMAGATFAGFPGGVSLRYRTFKSVSVMITQLPNVPEDVTGIRVTLPDGQDFVLPVHQSDVDAFAGSRMIFTMSKDNDLRWIAEWARYHSRHQGTDAVVFFDNGSSRYGTNEIAATIGAQGIEHVAVHSWPYIYGAPDPAALINPFYTQFLQVGSMTVALRRYGMRSAGLLNCDIDELVATPENTTIYDLVRQSATGLIVMRGRYVEPVAASGRPPFGDHRDYAQILANPKHSLSRPKKWVIDPNREWVKNLRVHPYMHWIENRPPFSKRTSRNVFYRHFRAINTNWKDRRTELLPLPGQKLIVDDALPHA